MQKGIIDRSVKVLRVLVYCVATFSEDDMLVSFGLCFALAIPHLCDKMYSKELNFLLLGTKR